MIPRRIKKFFLLPLIFVGGILSGCMGSGTGNPGAPVGAATSPGSTNQGPLQAATPPIGSQTTDQGWGNENPSMVFIAVAPWNGNTEGIYDPVMDEENGQTCTLSSGPSKLLFPKDEKPIVYGVIPMIYGAPTNSCGQTRTYCDYKGPKKSNLHLEVYAEYNDDGAIYRSDTVTIDCGKTYSSPVVLYLKPTFSQTGPPIPPNSPSGENGSTVPAAAPALISP